MSRCEIIELVNKLFIRNAKIKEVFIKKKKEKITRKERKEHLDQWKLSCELTKIIWHFFPGLSGLLKHLPDHRHQSYIKYGTHVLLMTKILSSIFYISSMRKTSETFNCEHAVQNIGTLCGEDGLSDAPYWETINNYLKELEPERLQEVVGQLVRRLLRMRSFDDARIRGRYWQVILDGTQLLSSRNELPGHCLYRVHNRGKENEYKEYYYYVLEAKLVLGENVVISIMTEFVENMEGEIEKQDCELKAAYRLLSRLREAFPRLPICICGDSLYAGMPFFELCKENNFPYLLRFKEGKIPYIYKEYMALRQEQGNVMKECYEGLECIYDYVDAVDYDGYLTTLISYEEYRTRKDRKKNKGDSKEHHKFFFLTDLRVSRKNQKQTVYYGRRRWLIENQGFNDQKNWGYNLEHRFSHNYKGMKNHYYLIQIAHMISQLVDALDTIWEKVRESRTQRHAHLLKAFCSESIKDNMSGGKRCLRIHSGSG